MHQERERLELSTEVQSLQRYAFCENNNMIYVNSLDARKDTKIIDNIT